MPDNLVNVQQLHDDWINSLIGNFQRELEGIVSAAQARTLAQLQGQITTTDGKIDRNVKNARALRKFDTLFLDNLDRAGYGHLLNELVGQFPGQLQFFQDTLDVLSEGMVQPLDPVTFGPRDLQVFADQGLNVKDSLQTVMESVAAQAKNRILMSVGGLPFADLAEALATYLHKALPEAVGLAETATVTYYRVIADRGYQIIEKDLPESAVRYKFEGPFDKLTRPFCKHLLTAGRTYTRERIDEMDNGQIPNVFISAGGWRCRHQWVVALDALKDVLSFGRVNPAVASKFGDAKDNAGVVLTNRQAQHIGDSHPELIGRDRLALSAVTNPDEVHRNKKDQQMAIFYRRYKDKYVRAAVLMQSKAGEKQHSIISARFASQAEVEAGRVRRVWPEEK
ncbi:hypothetical protein UFOVP130_39 [uncultured Caudovirales phage]|uniref:Uncharacterized protein n=1 Tax=uncultured Caudovirales phage TaxID=2100421 RepID=A0A6J5LD39_9CAUD|nr:hypothetical protein UFOVP130_39 [uncultured Caudovirales phage]